MKNAEMVVILQPFLRYHPHLSVPSVAENRTPGSSIWERVFVNRGVRRCIGFVFGVSATSYVNHTFQNALL